MGAKAAYTQLAFPQADVPDMFLSLASKVPALGFEATAPLPDSRADLFPAAPPDYLGAPLPGLEPRFTEDSKDGYICQLEAENQHLRSLLAHVRPGLTLPPPVKSALNPQLHPQEVVSEGSSLSYGLSFPKPADATQNLSASAAPFCPSYHWNQPSGDASSRGFALPEVAEPPELYVSEAFVR